MLTNLSEARAVEEGGSAALLDQHPLVPLLDDRQAAGRPGLGGAVLNLIEPELFLAIDTDALKNKTEINTALLWYIGHQLKYILKIGL